MSSATLRFALNHMACPALSPMQLLDAAQELGIDAVELRNDVRENSINNLDIAKVVGEKAKTMGIRVLSINALYPFNVWDDSRVEQARQLSALAAAAGAENLVCCPLNSGEHSRDDGVRLEQLRTSLAGLKPILEEFSLKGLIEPLGFPVSSLRLKQEALDAIDAVGAADGFQLVHDTFHHVGGQESDFFPARTGLVHVSGVEDDVSSDAMLDAHRVFVGPKDWLGTIAQIKQLLSNGYQGYISFEPFFDGLWTLENPVNEIRKSIEYIRSQL